MQTQSLVKPHNADKQCQMKSEAAPRFSLVMGRSLTVSAYYKLQDSMYVTKISSDVQYFI